MNRPRIIEHFRDIASGYDAALVDIWGVIHNGHAPFRGAVEACRRFRAERGPVVLISNSPRRSDAIPAQFDQIGVPRDFYDAIVTSGDATRDELKRRAPGPAFKLSPPKDEGLYEGLGLDFAEIGEAAFISCTGPFDDDNETPDDYEALFDAALARELPMVCANPDLVVQRGDRLVYCGGALAHRYAAMGGTAVYCGKPHAPIYRMAARLVEEAAGRAAAPERVIAIGDGPDTDLAGAAAHGHDALFIAQGIHAGELFENGALSAERLRATLEKTGRTAKHAARELVW